MSAPEEKKPTQKKAPEIKLSMTDHYIGILKLALEFNASVVGLVGSVVAMDSSGHNRTTHKRFSGKMDDLFVKYKQNVDYANRKILEQYFPTELKEDKDAGKES